MALSNSLISRFVKVTQDDTVNKKESIVYGTVQIVNGKTMVQIDGSEILTPMSSITTAKDGDRVKVEIKDHMAVIAGNMTSPAAMFSDLQDIDGKVELLAADVGVFGVLISDKASIGELEAHKAYITELLADKVTVDQLDAELATIDELISKKVSTDVFEAKTAEIDSLLANKATIDQLGAAEAAIGQLNANKANISDLDAINAEIKNLDTEKANIDELNAAKADIKNLSADVADIDTLIFGSASGTSIQTSFANAVIAMLGNAQIKSAMIESLSASKITSGDIITNNVRVLSEDGSLIISDETMQISDANRVRVQIGKDASDDYSINIWDANGKLMFSQGGITEDAIKESIIRNDMVAANANISASKLDIDSLFEEINGSTKTIKATKVYFDDKAQTLDLVFTQMSSDMNDLGEQVSSQGTQLSIMQGQIDSKIWKTDIDGAIDGLVIGGRNLIKKANITTSSCTAKIESTDNIQLTWIQDGNVSIMDFGVTLQPGVYTINMKNASVSTFRILSSTQLDSGYQHDTYYESQGLPYFKDMKEMPYTFTVTEETSLGTIFFYSSGPTQTITGLKLENSNKASDWTPAPEDLEGTVTTLSTQFSEFRQEMDEISLTVGSHTTQLANKAEGSEVAAVENKVTELTANLDGFKSTVSNTYATKTDVDNVADQLPWQTQGWVDATAYDENLWIPFVGNESMITKGYNRIRVSVSLNSGSTPSWGTHQSGFSVEFDVETKTSGWGTSTRDDIIHKDTYNWCSVSPVSYKQLGYINKAVLYLRGGGKYHVSTSWDTGWTAYPDGYLWTSGDSSQSANPSDTRPTPDGYMYGTKTEIKQLSDRITSTVSDVSNLGTRVSTVEQTAGGLSVRLDGVEGDIDTAIEDSALAKEMAITAQSTANTANSTANSVKTDLANNYSKKTLPDTRDDNQNPSWYITNYPKQIITEFKYTTVLGLTGETFCVLTTAVPWNDTTGGYPKQLAKVGAKEYWRVGTSGTTWGAWTDSYKTAVDAAKTATNYLNFSDAGLVIGDMTASTLGQNILIDSNSIDIRNGSTVMASYQADAVYLAMHNRNAIIDLCNGMGQIKNINDDPSNDWHRMAIDARDQITMDTSSFIAQAYHDDGNNSSTGMLSLQAGNPWMADIGMLYYTALSSTCYNNASRANTVSMMSMDGKEGYVDLHSEWYDEDNGDTYITEFKVDGGYNRGGQGIYGIVNGDYVLHLGTSMARIGSQTNTAYNTDIYGGNRIRFYLTSAGTNWQPYYTTEDTLNFNNYFTAGFVTNGGKDIYFSVPLSNPVIGTNTAIASSDDGLRLRQLNVTTSSAYAITEVNFSSKTVEDKTFVRSFSIEGRYTHNSSPSTLALPNSYSAWITGNGSAVTIKASFSTAVAVINNAPIGIQWDGYIEFA